MAADGSSANDAGNSAAVDMGPTPSWFWIGFGIFLLLGLVCVVLLLFIRYRSWRAIRTG